MDRDTKRKLLDMVRSNYDDIADSFDHTRKKPLWPELNHLVQEVQEGESVIDVGCGNGRLLYGLSDKNVRYLGVDSSEGLIQKAQQNFPQQEFRKGDILDLGRIEEVGFDHVFCVAVLHHIPGFDLRVQALQQLKNKVKKDGRIVVTVWNLWQRPNFRRLIFRYILLKVFKKNHMDIGDVIFEWKGENKDQIVKKRYYHAFTKRELKRIVRKSGLHLKELKKDKHNYYLILGIKK